MKLTLICTETDGWIDLTILSEGKELEVNSGTITIEQIVNLIIKCGYTELEVAIRSDCSLQSARSYKLYSFIESKRNLEFPYLDMKLTEAGRTDFEDYTSRYEKGIWSFLTGIYPGVPLNIIKHIYVGSSSLLPFAGSYIRKTAINSAFIIEVGNEAEMERVYSSMDYPNIIHFKIGDDYYLNYPASRKVKFQNFTDDYRQIRDTILNREMVGLNDGLSMSRVPNYFEQEGGSSLNRIAILSELHFAHDLKTLNKKCAYEIDSIEIRPISLMSLILFDSGHFADLCRYKQYTLEPAGSSPYQFYIGDGERRRVIDLATNKII